MTPNPHVRLFWDGDFLCATWHDFVNLVESEAGFGRTVSQACEALFACTGADRLREFQLRLPKRVDIDFADPAQVDEFLERIDASVTLEDCYGVKSWFIGWQHGTMSLQPGSERVGRATAAVFAHLWLRGIEAGLARDLACSYFDSRIGREA